MRFTVIHRIENDLPLVLLLDQQTGTEVSFIPSVGAQLHSFVVKTSHGAFNIIDHYTSLEDLNINNTRSHKSSKLSPFVCRIKDGKYHYDGREFEFINKFQDGSAIHGLLFDRPFKVTNQIATETIASVTMQYHYKQDDKAYPFDYSCLIKYQLKQDSLLSVETVVVNTGKQRLPIADGWHPYFTLGGKAGDWELYFTADQLVEFNDKLIPTGKLLPNRHFKTPEKIGATFLDNCFLLNKFEGKPSCTLNNPGNGLQLLFFPQKHYPYLQLYTPPHRNSIAVENLSAAPDCFNNGMGLTCLEPGHSQTFILGYQVVASSLHHRPTYNF
jgi:aldose 1-epimerase